jgi:hypothetical protein
VWSDPVPLTQIVGWWQHHARVWGWSTWQSRHCSDLQDLASRKYSISGSYYIHDILDNQIQMNKAFLSWKPHWIAEEKEKETQIHASMILDWLHVKWLCLAQSGESLTLPGMECMVWGCGRVGGGRRWHHKGHFAPSYIWTKEPFNIQWCVHVCPC